MMPVHVAALYGHMDCVRKLLSVMPEMDLNVPDDCGRTCLHAAACSGYVASPFIGDTSKLKRA